MSTTELPTNKPLLWVTNHPRPLKGMWPRRIGVEYIQGPPRDTHTYTSEELEAQGLIGVYVDMEAEEYYKLPLGKTPKDVARTTVTTP